MNILVTRMCVRKNSLSSSGLHLHHVYYTFSSVHLLVALVFLTGGCHVRRVLLPPGKVKVHWYSQQGDRRGRLCVYLHQCSESCDLNWPIRIFLCKYWFFFPPSDTVFSDEIKTFRCDHNSWRWERYVGGEERKREEEREGSVCGKRGGRREECGWEWAIQFRNSNFHVSVSLQATSLVSLSPPHNCHLRTEAVEIAR